MKKHTLQTLCTATLISLGLSFTATGEERITDVSLIFSYDQSPEGGKEVGELTAVSSSSQFTVEGSGYLKDDDTWSYGEWPVGEVELLQMKGIISLLPPEAFSIFPETASSIRAPHRRRGKHSDPSCPPAQNRRGHSCSPYSGLERSYSRLG